MEKIGGWVPDESLLNESAMLGNEDQNEKEIKIKLRKEEFEENSEDFSPIRKIVNIFGDKTISDLYKLDTGAIMELYKSFLEASSKLTEIPDQLLKELDITVWLVNTINSSKEFGRDVLVMSLKIIYNILNVNAIFFDYLLEQNFIAIMISLINAKDPEILAIIYSIISVFPLNIENHAKAFCDSNGSFELIKQVVNDYLYITAADLEKVPHYFLLLPYIYKVFQNIAISLYVPISFMEMIIQALQKGLQQYYPNINEHAIFIAQIVSGFVRSYQDKAIQIIVNSNFLSVAMIFLETNVFKEQLIVLALKTVRATLTAKDPELRQRVRNFISTNAIIITFLKTSITSEQFFISAGIINNLLLDDSSSIIKALPCTSLMKKVEESLSNVSVNAKIQIAKLVFSYANVCPIQDVRKLFSTNLMEDLLEATSSINISEIESIKLMCKLIFSVVSKVDQHGLRNYTHFDRFKELFNETLATYEGIDSNLDNIINAIHLEMI